MGEQWRWLPSGAWIQPIIPRARPSILRFPAPKNIVGYCYVFRALKVVRVVLHRTWQLNGHRQVGQKERFLQNSKENADKHTIGENILSVHAGHYCLLTSYTVAQFLCYFTTSAAQIIVLTTYEWVGCIGGMTFRRKLKYTHKDLSQYHFAHHKSHVPPRPTPS